MASLSRIRVTGTSRLLFIACLLVLTAYSSCRILTFFDNPWKFPGPGTVDFSEYWAASNLLMSGQNPYSGFEMFKVQQELGLQGDAPIMMWNPPWTFAITAPFASLPFVEAAQLWAGLGVVLLIATVAMTAFCLGGTTGILSALCAVGVLGPAIVSNFGFGQIGLILAFSVAGVLCCAVRSKWLFAGVFLAVSTIKPHIAFLLAIYLVWYCVRRRHWDFFIGGATMFASLALAPLLARADIYSLWMEALANPDPIVTSVKSWVTASLVGVLRYTVTLLTGTTKTVVLSVLLPGIAACITLYWSIRNGLRANFSHVCVTLTFLSVFFSPYGWLFDFSILLFPAAFTVQLLLSRNSLINFLWSTVIFVSAVYGSYWLLSYPETSIHLFFWYPVALFLPWLISIRGQNEKRSEMLWRS